MDQFYSYRPYIDSIALSFLGLTVNIDYRYVQPSEVVPVLHIMFPLIGSKTKYQVSAMNSTKQRTAAVAGIGKGYFRRLGWRRSRYSIPSFHEAAKAAVVAIRK